MNLFHKKVINYPDNGNGKNKVEQQYEINIDWEESYSVDEKKDTPTKESYCPSAELFRRLIEGTSFDRRISNKIEEPEMPVKSESPDLTNIPSQQELPAVKISPVKKIENKTNSYKPLKKKKFISNKEQSRLEHVVKKVFSQNNE
jgi:hypothetical protein